MRTDRQARVRALPTERRDELAASGALLCDLLSTGAQRAGLLLRQEVEQACERLPGDAVFTLADVSRLLTHSLEAVEHQLASEHQALAGVSPDSPGVTLSGEELLRLCRFAGISLAPEKGSDEVRLPDSVTVYEGNRISAQGRVGRGVYACRGRHLTAGAVCLSANAMRPRKKREVGDRMLGGEL
ncbi:hypothetical protein Z042_07695 [Chania multitudinisentens RB-25]|uniref:Uncharacterized protein n=1 Tax=Chania multitudinisentens RB-25 TaxID=1441930 RepID=W0LL30_9GAMM|nr:hypothetical protein [Chania multitudinisentens]AHG22710.1 hypothetical protein Z042_07695 [Chania multitudinisentens RB-25]